MRDTVSNIVERGELLFIVLVIFPALWVFGMLVFILRIGPDPDDL
jgi:hypothetical protein